MYAEDMTSFCGKKETVIIVAKYTLGQMASYTIEQKLTTFKIGYEGVKENKEYWIDTKKDPCIEKD